MEWLRNSKLFRLISDIDSARSIITWLLSWKFAMSLIPSGLYVLWAWIEKQSGSTIFAISILLYAQQ